MAATLQRRKTIDQTSPKSAEPTESVAVESAARRSSQARIGFGVMGAAIVIVLAMTTGMMLVMTDISVLAAFGLGLYCAFWLGIGFGTIFGAAAAFGGEH